MYTDDAAICIKPFGRTHSSAKFQIITLSDKYLLWDRDSIWWHYASQVPDCWFLPLPASHLLNVNMSIYEGSWEMINWGVMVYKYEIPGSLAGLHWREKCMISPWMHCSQGVINITAPAPSQEEMDS